MPEVLQPNHHDYREPIDLLLIDGTVVTMDAAYRVIHAGAVAVHQGLLVAIGERDELLARYLATEVLDCSGCAVLPGLINGHAHVPMSLLRGMVADYQQLDVWLLGYMFPVESQFVTPEFSYVGTLLSCAEMLRGGTTTFVDMYYFEEEVARAADIAGMRAICGQTVLRMPTPDAPSYDDGLERARAFIEAWLGHPRITPTIAPHAPYTCTDQIYIEAAALCAHFNVPLITHLSETAREVQESRNLNATTPIGYAQRVGAFDVPCIAAHCVHATEDDLLLMRAHGVGAVPCPSSNLKLASGIAPYQRLLAVGVRTGLGTDGPASNDDQDMFTEIHLAAMLPKGLTGDPTVMPARDALSLATNRGAEAIHMAHQIGSLEVGKRADVIVVRLDTLHGAPRYTYSPETIYSQLVYSTRSADVRDVFVDGVALLRDHELLTLDVAEIMQRAQQIADRINVFLAGREENLLDKILAIGGVRQAEIFEIQVKAQISEADIARIEAGLHAPDISITKASERMQYDTYFLFHKRERGRIRIREDRRLDPGARLDSKYTITLMEEGTLGDYPFALLLSRARYTAPADHSTRFYREYFHPDQEIEIEKHRRRWRILYQNKDFAVNVDRLVGHSQPGPFLEIKSRTWGRRDADERAALIGELLQRWGIDTDHLVKQEYIELER